MVWNWGANLLSLCAVFAALVFGFAPVPDAGGGGAADGDSDGDGDTGDTGDDGDTGDGDGDNSDAGGDPDADADPDADPDDDEDDRDLPDDVKNNPARLRTQRRRLQRELQPIRPLKDRLRGSDGRYLTADELDRRFGLARDMEEFSSFLNENGDLVQIILDRKAGKGRKAAGGGDDDDVFQDPFADPSKAPWDTTSESGRALLELFRRQAKENHDQKQAMRRLERSLGSVNERETHRTIAQYEQTWKTATIAAAAKVPEVARATFVRAVQRAFEIAKRDKTLGKSDVNRIIQEELAPFARAAKGQQRTNAAGQQRRAEGNRNLPRSNGSGRTHVANANETNNTRKETIKDARKSFFDRLKRG